MPAWVREGPFPLLLGFLLVVVFCRAQGTYWLGRAAAAGLLRGRMGGLLRDPRVSRGTRAVERWGLPVIPLSFLTIGFQTAVNVGAGLLRLGWVRYTLAMVPGCLAWALLYALSGTAGLRAGAAVAAGSPWAVAGVVVVAVAVLVVVRVGRRRRAAGQTAATATEDTPVDAA